MANKKEGFSEKEVKKLTSEIVKGEYPEEAEALLGENRGQLFVRIPQLVRDRFKLEKGQKMLFRITTSKENHVLGVKFIKRKNARN